MKRKTNQSEETGNSTYSFSFKKQVIEEIQNGLITQNRACSKYGLHRSTVQRWFQKMGNFETKMLHMKKMTPKEEIHVLKRMIKTLEQEKEILNLAIDIIEEDSGIDVRKKYLPESLQRIGKKKGNT
jgi:transposase